MNLNLNPGGLIGALAFGAAAAGVTLKLNLDISRVSKISIGALIGGAFVGNFTWALLFPGSETDEERDRHVGDRRRRREERPLDDDEEGANDRRRPSSKSRAPDVSIQKSAKPGQGMKQFGALLVVICLACLMLGGLVVTIFFPEKRGQGVTPELLFILVPYLVCWINRLASPVHRVVAWQIH